MTELDRRAEREKAERWFNRLTNEERCLLGDQLVLGTFDWRDWMLASKPSSIFLSHVDYLRMLWEEQT